MISERLENIEKNLKRSSLFISNSFVTVVVKILSILFFDKLAAKEILMERTNVKFTRE